MGRATGCWLARPTDIPIALVLAQGVIWFRLTKGPLHLVANQYFKLHQLEGGDHH